MTYSSLIASAVFLAPLALGKTAKSPTPPMGWNSYNKYNCYPNEEVIKLNAKGLSDLGFKDLGYDVVTVDCGWPDDNRDSEGRLQWNQKLFPSGPNALGDYIHGFGLKFGLYSGAGYLQCGSNTIPASLGFEEVDAKSFAEWKGDTLKYDNCYSTGRTNMADAESAESQSPDRFIKMGQALNETDRDIEYYICQWGIGTDVPEWAAPLGNSWRASNDIFNAWRSLWRIVNQAVPHVKHSGPGAFADLDMLIIGLNALSDEEERFHFGFWAMAKSPLMIGGVMDEQQIPQASLETMRNKEVIDINQDSLGKAAELVTRFTEEEWDVWAGDLSGGRKVLGVANWKNETQTVQVDLSLIGVSTAAARDVWAHSEGSVSGLQTFELKGHELRQLVLSDIQAAETPKPTGDYYSVENATIAGGNAGIVDCGSGKCLPRNKKVSYLDLDSSVTFNDVDAPKAGSLLVGVDFINYEYHHTIGDWESNTRNMTISVNEGEAKRWAFPLAGGDWQETGRLVIKLDGFNQDGSNKVVFRGITPGRYAPDLVGFEFLQ